MYKFARVFWLLLALPGGVCLAQEPIRVTTNMVDVSFTVRDSNGALVDSLTRDDVEIFEDGVVQKIAYFARGADLPLTLGLIVDFSGSQGRSLKQHKRDLKVFLEDVLGLNDRAFLVCFGNSIRLASDFSPSGPDLMDRLNACGDSDYWKFPEFGPHEERELGTAFFDSIFYSVAGKLAGEKGRRALLVFSDGEDNSSSHEMMTIIETAQNADVPVFTIRYTQDAHGKLTARNKYGISVMARVAKETGGADFDAKTTNARTYFREIGEELRSSYELGYYPTNSLKDDTFRKITIRPKRVGLKVRSKTGYFPR